MPKVLTQAQVDDFHEFGYCAPIDVMSEDEAHALKLRVEAAEAAYPEDLSPTNRNNTHLAYTCVDEAAHHPVIVGAVSDLIGEDILLYGSVLFFKEPKSTGFVSWHQDATYMGIEPHTFITPWLALTPSNPQLGCIKAIPGSHKDGIRLHHDTFGEDNILTRGQTVAEVDEAAAVDLILRPGQMSIHHARTVHGSMPNHSNERRMGIALQAYMGLDSRQMIGEHLVQVVQGCDSGGNFAVLPRPGSDRDEAGLKARTQANANWADILYEGASKIRDY